MVLPRAIFSAWLGNQFPKPNPIRNIRASNGFWFTAGTSSISVHSEYWLWHVALTSGTGNYLREDVTLQRLCKQRARTVNERPNNSSLMGKKYPDITFAIKNFGMTYRPGKHDRFRRIRFQTVFDVSIQIDYYGFNKHET